MKQNQRPMVHLIVMFSLLFSLSGCNDDDTNLTDITAQDWKLISIKLQNETISISQESYVNGSSYILRFPNSSTFFLDTSVNAASGTYSVNGESIELRNYQELSEVGTNAPEQLQINDLLLQQLKDVNRYSTTEDKLILYGDNEEFMFSRN